MRISETMYSRAAMPENIKVTAADSSPVVIAFEPQRGET